MAIPFYQRIQDTVAQIDAAASRVANDRAASAPLQAVVAEFRTKAHKAADEANSAGGATMRDDIVEVEQAGDSAKMAALADTRIDEQTRTAVLDAHAAAIALKREFLNAPEFAEPERSPAQENL